MQSTSKGWLRFIAVFAVLTLILVACGDGVGTGSQVAQRKAAIRRARRLADERTRSGSRARDGRHRSVGHAQGVGARSWPFRVPLSKRANQRASDRSSPLVHVARAFNTLYAACFAAPPFVTSRYWSSL